MCIRTYYLVKMMLRGIHTFLLALVCVRGIEEWRNDNMALSAGKGPIFEDDRRTITDSAGGRRHCKALERRGSVSAA